MSIFKILVLVGTFFFAPLRKQAYKSYRMKFLKILKCTKFSVRGTFMCKVGVWVMENEKYSLYSIKTIMPWNVPQKMETQRVCVCVCVCVIV